jgi:hypothetical protein
MNKRKEYLITIFIKTATAYYATFSSLNKSFELLCISYPNVSTVEVEELRKKFTITEYIKKITPVIDEIFSEEELKTVIDFYKSEPGSKLFNNIFLKKIDDAGSSLFLDLEKEFKLKNAENQPNT